MPTPPSEFELRQLPLRALVAYTVRAARRLQPCLARAGDAQSLEHVRLIATVLDIAERFAAGVETATKREIHEFRWHRAPAARSYFAKLDRHAERAADAACAAIGAVHEVYGSTAEPSKARVVLDFAGGVVTEEDDDLTVQAAVLDLFRLQGLRLGDYPEFGDIVDPSESGPLGVLWREGEPQFHQSLAVKYDTIDRQLAPLTLYFDPAIYSPTQIAEILHLLSELYRSVSGGRLVIRGAPEKKTADYGVRVGG